MKIEHVALSIQDRNEVERFYVDILGMDLINSFTLSKAMAKDIFEMDEATEVFFMQMGTVRLELFLAPEKSRHAFEHLCISTKRRAEMFKVAESCSYSCFRQEREHSDLIFISDKSGNIFEVKECNQT